MTGDRECIAVTDPAGLNPNAHLVTPGLWDLTLLEP
jgi:hypothetical protein